MLWHARCADAHVHWVPQRSCRSAIVPHAKSKTLSQAIDGEAAAPKRGGRKASTSDATAAPAPATAEPKKRRGRRTKAEIEADKKAAAAPAAKGAAKVGIHGACMVHVHGMGLSMHGAGIDVWCLYTRKEVK